MLPRSTAMFSFAISTEKTDNFYAQNLAKKSLELRLKKSCVNLTMSVMCALGI